MATTTTTTTKSPTVLLVPGFWEGPNVLQPLSAALSRAGITTVRTAALRSTGHAAPLAPTDPPEDTDSTRKHTFGDDTAGVREAIRAAVEEAGSAGVVLFLHSVAGVVGCNALEGLDFGAWGRRGDGVGGGGVRKIVFCAAGVAPVGFDGFGGPFVIEHQDEKGAYCTCLDAKDNLFHDLPDDQAERWHKALQIEPSVKYWASTGPVTHAGWRDVPSTYILCELDRLLPAALQETLAGVAGSKVVRLEAGHYPFLSRTEDVAKIIIDEVNSVANV